MVHTGHETREASLPVYGELLLRRATWHVTQFRMQMLRSQQRALYASRIRSIRSAGGSYLAWASGTTAME
jgi:hypothetical protein